MGARERKQDTQTQGERKKAILAATICVSTA